MSQRIIILPLLTIGLWSWSSVAATYSSTQGKVDFEAIGNPKKLLIHGKSEQLVSNFKADKKLLIGQVIFDLSTLETGMSLRDRHMKEKYLEVDKFKTATLKLNPIELPANQTADLKGVKFDGKLTLHGVEKPVQGTATIKMLANSINIDAAFAVNTKDFDIVTPSFAGLTVAEEVKVTTQLEAKVEEKTKQ